jgi:hypothetical protein
LRVSHRHIVEHAERREGDEMANWFTSMFSGEPEEGDVVKTGALNITKITALLAPIGTGIAALIDTQVKNGPLDGLTPGQKLTLWIALLAFIGLVVVADIYARSTATAAALQAHIAPLPSGLKATWIRQGADAACTVVAVRGGDLGGGGGGELLLVPDKPDDQTPRAAWVAATSVKFE